MSGSRSCASASSATSPDLRGLVLHVEPDHSAATLYARPGRERARQPIAAAAMLEFDLDQSGLSSNVVLHSVDERIAGEFALVRSVERRLAELDRAGGRLVTCGGQNDLTMIRMGVFRHRDFALAGALTWLRDEKDAHDDVLEMINLPTAAGAQVAEFMAGVCGARPAPDESAGPRRRERAKAEFDAVQTLTAYFFLLAERERSLRPLACGVAAIAEMICGRMETAPHLAAILNSDLFETLAPPVF